MRRNNARVIEDMGKSFTNTIRAAMGEYEAEVCPFCHTPVDLYINDARKCHNPECFMFETVVPLPVKEWVKR